MMSERLPKLTGAGDYKWSPEAPEPAKEPELFQGVPTKRVIAYLVDILLIAVFAAAVAVIAFVPVVLTLGMLKPFVVGIVALIPLAYHTLLIGGDRPATLGMRLLGIEVRTLTGAKPGYAVALIQTVMFYVTVGLTSWLILLVALFNQRSRTVHDFLCGTMVINTLPVRAAAPTPPPQTTGQPAS